MKKLILTLCVLLNTTIFATEVTWLEAKDSMECNVEDPTIVHLSNYLIKSKFDVAVSDIFQKLGIKYLNDSLVIKERENTTAPTEKDFYVTGSVFTKKGSLIKLTDKRYSSEESTLSVKLTTREVESYEYDSEGIPVLRTWVCTVTTSSGDLGIRLINQSQNDFSVGSMKVRLNEIYKFEKVEKL